jgi:hypothetical protein
MNIFDGIQKAAQAVVTNTMGYDATWVPLAGGDAFTGRVLFNEPTNPEEVAIADFEAMRPRVEFFEGDFPGLFESARKNKLEVIEINGRSFVTMANGSKKFDGKTIMIYLQEQI